jgi:TPR repeat protein
MDMDKKVGAVLEADTEAEIMMCVDCGIAEGDDIKLEECVGCFHHHHAGCQSVSYCSPKCREKHLEEHKEECKKRKAELHDRELFTQPASNNLGECPICFLPLPIDPSKSDLKSCCSKYICLGCVLATAMSYGDARCPFCREPPPDNKGESHKRLMKRVKANDPAALRYLGGKCYEEGDYDGVLKYLTKAAELGNDDAHYGLAVMYRNGQGVEKDEKKQVYHMEEAAIGGHPKARFHLANHEAINGHIERAVKHYIIAANLGDEESMKKLWEHYYVGNITKEDLEATLRTHQAALDEMKSSQREKAEAEAARMVFA